MKITKQFAKDLTVDINAALDAVAHKHDIGIRIGSGSYDDHNLTLKLEIVSRSEDGVMLSVEAQAFKRQACVFGLKAKDLGREFTWRGAKYTICGLKPKSPKFPILAIRKDGRTCKFGAEMVVRALK